MPIAFNKRVSLGRGAGRLQRRQTSRGGALLTVLWLSAGLAAVGFSVASSVRTETERVSTSAEGLRASYLAAGALERGLLWMVWGPDYRRPDGSPMFWQTNQPRMTMRFPSGAAVIEVIPENSKLSINTASPDDLYRLVLAVSGDDAKARLIAQGIVDWRTPAVAPSLFDQYYFSIRPTFRARHASFQEIEELLLVRGMTPELFYGNYTADPSGRLYARGGLRDALSIWGSLGPFDANTASPALLESVGVSSDAVTAIVARRQVLPIRDFNELAALTPPVPRLGLNAGISMWTLRATARLTRPDGSASDVVRTAAATVRLQRNLNPRIPRDPYPIRVLRWYDDAWSQAILPPPDPAAAGGNRFTNPMAEKSEGAPAQ